MLMFVCSHHSGNGSEDSAGGSDERAYHYCTYVGQTSKYYTTIRGLA
jgi:hypothetical protein